jgi:hypothetical protein
LLGVDETKLADVQNEWIDATLKRGMLEREPQWSEALAVGRRSFVDEVKVQLGHRARYRKVGECNGVSVLREASASYGHASDAGIDALRQNGRLDAHDS